MTLFCYPQAGPGPTTTANKQSGRSQPSIVLDDDDDTRYVVEHPTAGKVFSSADKDGDITMKDNTIPIILMLLFLQKWIG